MTGIIFDIKEFAIYDGPGVRQTVFLKGCPLHCEWCHNPEGLSGRPELGVSAAACTNCGKCYETCKNADTWDTQYIRSKNCDLCQECIHVCPMGLRRVIGQEYTPQTLVHRIMEKAGYYRQYGGGVTFSGGEPLMQGGFLSSVLDLLPDVHTAIETSGYADASVFEEVVRKLDYVIMDIKCMSDEIHKQYIGVSNEKILKNYQRLRDMQKIHTIRIPLISGVNDTWENLEQTAKMLAGDAALDKVELLPYQKTAGAKYKWVGREYTPAFDTEAEVNAAADLFEQYGVRCNVL